MDMAAMDTADTMDMVMVAMEATADMVTEDMEDTEDMVDMEAMAVVTATAVVTGTRPTDMAIPLMVMDTLPMDMDTDTATALDTSE